MCGVHLSYHRCKADRKAYRHSIIVLYTVPVHLANGPINRSIGMPEYGIRFECDRFPNNRKASIATETTKSFVFSVAMDDFPLFDCPMLALGDAAVPLLPNGLTLFFPLLDFALSSAFPCS